MHSIKIIKWLRYSGSAEGISSLLLFFVGMPLMYVADKPEAVRITGTIHGILFVIYVVILMQAALVLKQPLSWSVKNYRCHHSNGTLDDRAKPNAEAEKITQIAK